MGKTAGYQPVDKKKTKAPGQGWLLLFYANVFFACASFSIVVPTMYASSISLVSRLHLSRVPP